MAHSQHHSKLVNVQVFSLGLLSHDSHNFTLQKSCGDGRVLTATSFDELGTCTLGSQEKMVVVLWTLAAITGFGPALATRQAFLG